MKKGSVLFDIAVDQGGCFEATHATTHSEPTFTVGDCILYCVANMPGAVSLTSTLALTSTTLPYGLKIADKGARGALQESAELMYGLNVYRGVCTCAEVAQAFGLAYSNPDTLI